MAVGWFLADQLTKTWAENELATRNIDIVGSLRLNLAYNTGTAFSLGGGGSAPGSPCWPWSWSGVLVWQGRSVRTRTGAVALAMIVGGALGNVFDRAFRGDGGFMQGAVVDFLDLQWWPIFNLADVGIVVGGILLVVVSFRAKDADDGDEPPDGPDRVSDSTAARRRWARGPRVHAVDGLTCPSKRTCPPRSPGSVSIASWR